MEQDKININFGVIDDFNNLLYKKPDILETIITPNHVGDYIIQNLISLYNLQPTMPVIYTSMKDVGKYNHIFSPLMIINETEILDNLSPIAMIRAVAEMLKYTFDRKDLSDIIDMAISNTLDEGYRTKDLTPIGEQEEYKPVSTLEFGEIVLSEFIKLYEKQ